MEPEQEQVMEQERQEPAPEQQLAASDWTCSTRSGTLSSLGWDWVEDWNWVEGWDLDRV